MEEVFEVAASAQPGPSAMRNTENKMIPAVPAGTGQFLDVNRVAAGTHYARLALMTDNKQLVTISDHLDPAIRSNRFRGFGGAPDIEFLGRILLERSRQQILDPFWRQST